MQPCTTNILVNAVVVVRFVGLHPIKPHTPPLKTNPVKYLGWDPRWSITRPLTYLSTTDCASRPVTGQTNWVSNPGCSRRLSPRMMQLDPPVLHFRRPRSSVSRTISIQPHVSVLLWRAPIFKGYEKNRTASCTPLVEEWPREWLATCPKVPQNPIKIRSVTDH